MKDQAVKKMKESDLALFCYQFSVVLKSGIPYVEALHLLSDEALDAELKQHTQAIAKAAQSGMPLSEAFEREKVFPVYMLEMIAISEQTGRLAEVFEGLSEYYEQIDDTKRKLKSALTYPVVLIALMTGVVLLLVLKILPIFNEVLQAIGGEMPKATRVILGASTALKDNLGVVFAVILLVIVALVTLVKAPFAKGFRDKCAVSMWGVRSLYKKSVAVKFSKAYSMLVKSGMDAYGALEMVIPLMDNHIVVERLNASKKAVAEGASIGEALAATELFNPLFLKMVQVGVKAGTLEDTLDKTAAIYNREMDRSIQKMTVSVEPILVFVLSFIVGIILLLVMLPLIDIMSAIG